ncbi:HEAT domain containing protein [Crinalium epipsammum PCC 9333]|uniref:HEAT domain containing protein n=1 Tax=Crinalium epipsammum PCC 9333 TaxID=1173022 RepID=K9VZV3_9CYAN|nr:HEAT repeat domain-containing protein [Crinalium epipsammum]AFZ12700.1 HEAT domain containing protein [Crinalium epipsammum PCC 9333]
MTHSASALELIQSVEQADSPSRLVAAVQALAKARLKAGIPTLITVLGYNNPEAASAALDGLIQLGEAAVPLILEKLDDYNYGARAYSFRALAAIADPRALDVLISAAETDFAPSVRRAAAKGLGNLRWLQLPIEQRQIAQPKAMQTLLLLVSDPEWAIRYAAVVGLQALAASGSIDSPELFEQILAEFAQIVQTDSDLAIRARAAMAQEQLKANTTQLTALSY